MSLLFGNSDSLLAENDGQCSLSCDALFCSVVNSLRRTNNIGKSNLINVSNVTRLSKVVSSRVS